MEALCFEQLNEGQWWTSRTRTITETDVVNFACLTGDSDPLHVDHEFVKTTPFRRPIAHGLLGLTYLAGLSSIAPTVQTAAFLGVHDWKFVRPLYIGDTVHVVSEVVEKESTGRRRGRVIWQRTLLNQAGETIQKGAFTTLVLKACANRVGPEQRKAA